MAAEVEDLERLAVEVSALGTRLDVMVQEIGDVREDWRRRAQSLEDGESSSRHVHEIAACIQAVEETIKSAVSASIEASAAELRSELCPRIEAMEAQFAASLSTVEISQMGGHGSHIITSSAAASKETLATPEAVRRQLDSIEAEVPLLAKAIVSGAQDVSVRIAEERSLRQSADAAMEFRLARIEAEVCSLFTGSHVHTPIEGTGSSKATSLPDSPTPTTATILPPGMWISRCGSVLPTTRNSMLASRDEEELVPAAPPPTARLEDEASPVQQEIETKPGTSSRSRCTESTGSARILGNIVNSNTLCGTACIGVLNPLVAAAVGNAGGLTCSRAGALQLSSRGLVRPSPARCIASTAL